MDRLVVVPVRVVQVQDVGPVKTDGGFVASDPAKDILKVAVIERHMASGRIAKGLVKGFGLKKGAIACLRIDPPARQGLLKFLIPPKLGDRAADA